MTPLREYLEDVAFTTLVTPLLEAGVYLWLA